MKSMTTKKTELKVEPETLVKKVKETPLPQSLHPKMVPKFPTKEIMSKAHLLKMLEMFSDLKLKLKLELPNQRPEEEMTVTMNQLAEVEVEEEEEEEVEEVEIEVDTLAEMLKYQELTKKETSTLIMEEVEEEEEVELEVALSTRDSIEKTVPEEPIEVEEKETIEELLMPMLEVMNK